MNICRGCFTAVDEVLTSKKGHKCKSCISEYNKAYREAHKDHIAATKAAWKQRNAEHVKQRDKTYALNNADKKSAARKRWVERHPETNKASKQRWLDSNPDKRRAVGKKYAAANRDLIRACYAKRRAAKKLRTPVWLTEDELWLMREAYDLAAHRIKLTNIGWEVDHIVPISGSSVSGLHVPWNLQVITKTENRAKSSKLPPENQLIGGGW